MAISARLIKRIEAAEKKAVMTKVPDLIWLRYDWEKGKFAAIEQYFSDPGKGSKNRVQHFDHYKDYIILYARNMLILKIVIYLKFKRT